MRVCHDYCCYYRYVFDYAWIVFFFFFCLFTAVQVGKGLDTIA